MSYSSVVKTVRMLIFFIPVILSAQWNFSISTSQEINDNPFHFPEAESSFISSFNLGVERKFDSFGIGYYSNYSNFSNLQDRNYYWHQFGFWNSTDNVMVGLYAEQRINKIDYEYFDYSNYNAYIKHKTKLKGINIYSQGSLTLTDYSQLTDLNNILASLGTKFIKSFETKTTLISGVTFNYKNYYSTNLDTTTQSFGMRRWSNIDAVEAYTTQLNYFARIAQSITPTTGLAVQYSGKNIIGGTAKSVRELEYAYGDESEYFDDPISYEGYTYHVQLTQILPLEIMFRASYYYNYKEYPSQGIYTDELTVDENIVRLDKQKILSFYLTKGISLDSKSNYLLNLSLGYQSIINESNSYWYDYKSSQLNLGIDFQF